MFAVSFFIGIYYNMIIAWCFFYMFASFASDVPWKTCSHKWNSRRGGWGVQPEMAVIEPKPFNVLRFNSRRVKSWFLLWYFTKPYLQQFAKQTAESLFCAYLEHQQQQRGVLDKLKLIAINWLFWQCSVTSADYYRLWLKFATSAKMY